MYEDSTVTELSKRVRFEKGMKGWSVTGRIDAKFTALSVEAGLQRVKE